MINYFKVTLIGVMASIIVSCQSDTSVDEPTVNAMGKTFELTSSMSDEDFMATCVAVKSQVGSLSRATQLTEAEAKQVMQPLVNDGLQLKTQIVRQVELDPSLSAEAAYFKDLSEEDCAALSFVFHSMKEVGMDTDIVAGAIDKNGSQTMSAKTDRILHCLAVAVGYDFMKKLTVKGVISAVTVCQAIIAIGKRYLGYVGVVLMVADFVGCVG